jgi:hypothetical protein
LVIVWPSANPRYPRNPGILCFDSGGAWEMGIGMWMLWRFYTYYIILYFFSESRLLYVGISQIGRDLPTWRVDDQHFHQTLVSKCDPCGKGDEVHLIEWSNLGEAISVAIRASCSGMMTCYIRISHCDFVSELPILCWIEHIILTFSWLISAQNMLLIAGLRSFEILTFLNEPPIFLQWTHDFGMTPLFSFCCGWRPVECTSVWMFSWILLNELIRSFEWSPHFVSEQVI